MNARFLKWLLTATIICCFSLVATNVTAKKPPPDPEPVLSQPAFAYYCKSNPNMGAICLSNADGSAPVKIFTTSKFQGSNFQIAAFQDEIGGKVLVEDRSDLWSIEYTVDSGGFLAAVEDPRELIEGGVWLVDWSPNGNDFAFPVSGQIYLGDRIDYDTGELGNPIVVMPPVLRNKNYFTRESVHSRGAPMVRPFISSSQFLRSRASRGRNFTRLRLVTTLTTAHRMRLNASLQTEMLPMWITVIVQKLTTTPRRLV